jgi:S-layer protein
MSLSGDKVLTLTSAAGLTALKTVTVSGSAGLSANLSALVSGGSINASGTSGANTVTVKSTVASYTGGTGVDTVTTTTDGVSKAIALGDGDDSLTIGAGITTLTAAVSGGAGNDRLTIDSADADTADGDASFVANLSGFEKLTLSGATSGKTVDVQKFGPGNDVTMTVTATTTISNVPANPTVTISGAQAGTLTVTGADVTGSSDVLNLVQTNATGGIVAAAGYETINLTASVASGVINLTDAALKTLNIGGSKSTTVTLNAANVSATTIDASGNSGGVTITSVSTAAAKITGGSGNDVLTMKTGSTAETLIGNAGNDKLTSNAGLSTMTGGSGFDTFVIGAPGATRNVYSTITDFSAGDSLQLSTNKGTETFNKTALALADTASFSDFLNLAAAGDGSTNGAISFFYFGGNTYVVEDLSATATFVDGTDVVVRLSGIVDLSNSTLQGTDGNILLNGGV